MLDLDMVVVTNLRLTNDLMLLPMRSLLLFLVLLLALLVNAVGAFPGVQSF